MLFRSNLLDLPGITQTLQKQKEFSGSNAEEIAKTLYGRFNQKLVARLAEHATMIPGAEELLRALHKRGIRTGSSTGYTREMLAVILEELAPEREVPEIHVACNEVEEGRPSPAMLNKLLDELNVQDRSRVLSVGDTFVDMQAAKNANIPAVGVIVGSSALGLSEKEWENCTVEEQEKRMVDTEARFLSAGADYVIASIGDLLPLLEEIESNEPIL